MNANDSDLPEQTPASDGIATSKATPPSGAPVVLPPKSASAFELPDWAPWMVLAGVVTFGVLGGTGLVRFDLPASAQTKTAAASPTVVVGPRRELGPALSAKAEVAAEDEKASVLHLVVTYEGTMLGKSLKIQRSAAEAKERALEALARARKGEDFQTLVNEYTDQPPTAGQKGALLGFKRSQALHAFSEASFALNVGQISGLVETKFGYHVIKRTK